MLAQMPDTVQHAWGEAAARDFAAWLEAVMAERTVGKDAWHSAEARFDHLSAQVDARFDEVDRRFVQVDARFDEVDRRFVQIDARFDEVDRRFLQIDARFDEVDRRFAQIDARFDEVDRRFAQIEARLGALETEFRDFRREVYERFDRVVAMFDERFDRQATEFNARFDHQASELNARFSEVQQAILMQTRWTVGTLALLGTIIAILVGIGQLGL